MFVRHAWEQIEAIEALIGKPMGQGNTVVDPPDELLAVISGAYERASKHATTWDGTTYYVAFGHGQHRDWDDAREYGFVAAGGGAWYSKTLRQLEPGNRVLVYIPKGNGVGGYVGAGEVIGGPTLARDFVVTKDGTEMPLTEASRAPDMARGGTADPDIAEWIVPVRWIESRSREAAIKDSDFFANQNSAVRLTHGYTLKRLSDEFGLDAGTASTT